MTYSPFFHVRCLLEEISPPIWRSLRVPQWLTFGQFERLIRAAFGWSADPVPAGRFEVGGKTLAAEAGNPDGHVDGWRLLDWFVPGLRFILTTGSGWQIAVQGVGLAPDEPDNMTVPRCLAGERAAPPEEMAGPAGYQRMLKHPKQRGLWNPERFDLEAVNRALLDAARPLVPLRTPQREAMVPVSPDSPGFFLKENDVQFDLHAYYLELETAYWQEKSPETLREALAGLEREDMLGLCMVYGLAADMTFRRTQAERLLREQLPEAIRLQVPFLDDRQYGLLRQVVTSPEGRIQFARADMLFSPYELYYFRDRLLLFPRLIDGEAWLYMLPEIREALRLDPMQSLSRTQLQNANRRKILCGMFQYYGIMTMASLQEVLSELLGETVDQDTLVVDVQELQDFYDAVSIGDMLVMHTALDPDAAAALWAEQMRYAGLPHRKCSLETFDMAGEWMFVEATQEAEVLISFLESRYGLNTGAAEGIAWELMHRFRWGEPLKNALDMAATALRHPDVAAEQRFAELVAQVWVHAPAWRYKGWTPAQVREITLTEGEAWPGMESADYALAMKLIADAASTTGSKREGTDAVREPEDPAKRKPAAHKRAGRVLHFPGGPQT
jgi:hypothetical protein